MHTVLALGWVPELAFNRMGRTILMVIRVGTVGFLRGGLEGPFKRSCFSLVVSIPKPDAAGLSKAWYGY